MRILEGEPGGGRASSAGCGPTRTAPPRPGAAGLVAHRRDRPRRRSGRPASGRGPDPRVAVRLAGQAGFARATIAVETAEAGSPRLGGHSTTSSSRSRQEVRFVASVEATGDPSDRLGSGFRAESGAEVVDLVRRAGGAVSGPGRPVTLETLERTRAGRGAGARRVELARWVVQTGAEVGPGDGARAPVEAADRPSAQTRGATADLTLTRFTSPPDPLDPWSAWRGKSAESGDHPLGQAGRAWSPGSVRSTTPGGRLREHQVHGRQVLSRQGIAPSAEVGPDQDDRDPTAKARPTSKLVPLSGSAPSTTAITASAERTPSTSTRKMVGASRLAIAWTSVCGRKTDVPCSRHQGSHLLVPGSLSLGEQRPSPVNLHARKLLPMPTGADTPGMLPGVRISDRRIKRAPGSARSRGERTTLRPAPDRHHPSPARAA